MVSRSLSVTNYSGLPVLCLTFYLLVTCWSTGWEAKALITRILPIIFYSLIESIHWSASITSWSREFQSWITLFLKICFWMSKRDHFWISHGVSFRFCSVHAFSKNCWQSLGSFPVTILYTSIMLSPLFFAVSVKLALSVLVCFHMTLFYILQLICCHPLDILQTLKYLLIGRHIGRHIDNTDNYSINNIELENIESLKDLGVTFDSHLKCELHMSEKLIKPTVFLLL